ncbi:hypothetical protein ACKWTF_014901 [Chironomus riparius]
MQNQVTPVDLISHKHNTTHTHLNDHLMEVPCQFLLLLLLNFKLIKENFLVSTSLFELFFSLHVDSFCCRFSFKTGFWMTNEHQKQQQQQSSIDAKFSFSLRKKIIFL